MAIKTKGIFFFTALLLVLSATFSRSLALFSFQQTTFLSINETEHSLDLTLRRDSTEGPATVPVLIITFQEFNSRDKSTPGSCQATLNPTSIAEAQDSDFSGDRTINVQFADGATESTFAISIANDNFAEPLEGFVVMIGGTDAAANCALPIVIRDDDTIRFRFSEASLFQTVVENTTYNNLMILKAGGSHEQDITVTISLRSTSVDRRDFFLAQTVFVFNDSITSQVVPIMLFNSAEVEASESFSICFGDIAVQADISVLTESPSCFRVTLLSDDETVIGLVGYEEPRVEVEEGSQVELCVGTVGGATLSGFVEISVSLTVNTTDSANRATFSAFTTGGTLNVDSPSVIQVAASFRNCFDVMATENSVVDGNAVFVLSIAITGPPLMSRILHNEYALVILDNDVSTIELRGSGTAVVREGSGGVITLPQFTLFLAAPSPLTYEVSLRIEPEGNSDFIRRPIVIDAMMTSVPLTFELRDDDIPEALERFTLSIRSISVVDERGGPTPTSAGSVTVDIYDDDVAVGFNETEFTLEEGGKRGLSVRIEEPSLGNVDPQASPIPLSLEVERLDDPEGAVLLTVDPEEGVALSASTSSATLQLAVATDDDDVCEGDRRYSISFSSQQSATTVAPRSAIIIVPDDDCATASTTRGVGIATGQGMNTGPTTHTPTEEPRKVCVLCIVLPILILLLLIALCILILLIFCCCKKCCWHTYDPEKREKKFGMEAIPTDDDEIKV